MSIISIFTSDSHTCENGVLQCARMACGSFLFCLFFNTVSIQRKKNGFSSKTVWVTEEADGQTEGRRDEQMDRRTHGQTDWEMKDSIKFMVIKIKGRHQNEKDADESEGLCSWITIVIYLLQPGCFLSITSHHSLPFAAESQRNCSSY